MDRLEFAQLERLWHALERVGTTQEDEDVVISEPFCSLYGRDACFAHLGVVRSTERRFPGRPSVIRNSGQRAVVSIIRM